MRVTRTNDFAVFAIRGGKFANARADVVSYQKRLPGARRPGQQSTSIVHNHFRYLVQHVVLSRLPEVSRMEPGVDTIYVRLAQMLPTAPLFGQRLEARSKLRVLLFACWNAKSICLFDLVVGLV